MGTQQGKISVVLGAGGDIKAFSFPEFRSSGSEYREKTKANPSPTEQDFFRNPTCSCKWPWPSIYKSIRKAVLSSGEMRNVYTHTHTHTHTHARTHTHTHTHLRKTNRKFTYETKSTLVYGRELFVWASMLGKGKWRLLPGLQNKW